MKNNIHTHPTKHLFVHVPKSAGKSIFVMLNNGRTNLKGSHAPAKDYKRYLGEDYNNYFSFAFVRNPWDRMVSLYHYSKQTYLEDLYKHEVDFKTFKTFLQTARNKCRFFHVHMKTQSSYLYDDNKILVKYVGRFETLEKDIRYIFNHIGKSVPIELEHIHKTKRKPYSQYYDDETICIVHSLFTDDIKRFNYSYA